MSKIKSTTYLDSKHTKNNYLKSIKVMTHQELLSEYNKVRLLMNMMKHRGVNSIKPYPDKNLKQDNIKVITYKYNIVCQEITVRGYHIMNENYHNKNVRYKSL